MSTILKALRRLEEDKTSQIRRPLGEPIGNPTVLTQGRGWLVAVAALSVGIGLGAVGLLLLPRAGFDHAPGIAATPAPGLEIPVPGLAPILSSPETPGSPEIPIVLALPVDLQPEVIPGEVLSQAAFTSGVEIADQVALPTNPIPERQPPDGAESHDTVSDNAGDRAVVAVTLEPSQESPPPLTIEVSPAVSAPLRPARLASSKLARVPIPAVSVARTIWHPRSERRVAEINVEGRAVPLFLREGDAVGPLVVSQIDPSGVVFLHDQIEVRRRVGVQ